MSSWNYDNVNSYAKIEYKNQSWGDLEIIDKPFVQVHIGAGVLHYAQSCFEGSKAIKGKDGKVRLFRIEQNALRMQRTCDRALMPRLPVDKFIEAVEKIVHYNLNMCPEDSEHFLYIRPLLFASGPTLALRPSSEYTFIVSVIPVPDYYANGEEVKAMTAMVFDEFDRSAPKGTGRAKLAANYAGTLLPEKLAKENGAQVALFLDALTHTKIEEFSTSNFIGISSNGSYITPNSPSVLWSITNDSLQKLAEEEGLKVERRDVLFSEISTLKEAGACGTAVSISPVKYFLRDNQTYSTQQEGESYGPILRKLRDKLRAIQYGEEEDKFNWVRIVE